MSDEFHIWERLLLNVQREIRGDEDGIARNLQRIEALHKENEWIARRLDENRDAERVLQEKA